jgi:Tfp pilus assembly protein PilN
MLTINLLQASVRKTGLVQLQQLHRMPLVWVALSMLVALPVALLVPTYVNRYQLGRLTASIKTLEPKQRELEALRRVVQDLQSEEIAFQSLKQGPVLWAERLSILSSVTPEGVWFTDLTLDQAKGLMIRGSAVGRQGSDMVNVGRLVQDLKASPEVLAAVKDIQIESIKRVQDKEIEVVQFTLACSLRQPLAP